jgi:CBS domain-containing protein
MMARRVREIMTGEPMMVRPESDLASVARVMRDNDIGCVLVGDGEDLHGLLTDRDIVVRGLARGLRPAQATAGGICSGITVKATPADEVSDLVRRLRESAVRRAPVIEDGRPVGIVSLGDLAMEMDSDSALADISAAPSSH